jgi:DNA-binding response OmpR family regulator
VASIRILEPDSDTRNLLELLVCRLGHRPTDGERPELVLLEPASAEGTAVARELRRRHAALPIVCVSILPPERRSALRPAAWLVKPIARRQLGAAIDLALAR